MQRRENISEKLALSFLQKWQNLSIVAYLAALIALKKVLGYSTTKSQRICIYPKQYIHLILSKNSKAWERQRTDLLTAFRGRTKATSTAPPVYFSLDKEQGKTEGTVKVGGAQS